MLSKFVCNDLRVLDMLTANFSKWMFMNVLDPIGNPSITIPSMVSFPTVKVFMHSSRIFFEVSVKNGIGDMWFVDVRVTLLSSRMRSPKLLASCVKVLQ